MLGEYYIGDRNYSLRRPKQGVTGKFWRMHQGYCNIYAGSLAAESFGWTATTMLQSKESSIRGIGCNKMIPIATAMR